MYNQHFGLEKAPFKITPDTGMFFTGAGRGEVLEALVYAIVSGEGIIKVVGEVGTGKTMLCRMLELKLPENVDIVYLANPSLTPEDILHAIALEMALDVGSSVNRIQVLHRIQQHLLEMHARNRHVVVLVEEAQSMPTSTLEEIRLLSNLETKQDKLLQIVLFGQPELDENLSEPGIRQLRDRITHSFYLDPLDPSEIREYVDFRLRGAGFRGRDAFRKGAYEMMARTSEGLTRRVNILADKALLAAFAEDTHDVTRKHVRIAANDSQFARQRRWGWPEIAVGVGLVTITVAIGWAALGDWGEDSRAPEPLADASGSGVFVSDVQADAGPPLGDRASAEQPTPVAASVAPSVADAMPAPLASEGGTAAAAGTVAPAPEPAPPARLADEPTAREAASALAAAPIAAAPVVPAPVVPAPVIPGPVVPAPLAISVAVTPADEPRAAPAAISTTPPAMTVARLEATAELSRPVVSTRSATLASATPTPTMPGPAAPRQPAPATAARAASPPRAATPPPGGSLLDYRLDATRDWLARADRSHYSIQLLVTDVSRRSNLEAFLRERERANELEGVYVYRTDINGESRYGVLFREYASFAEARDALERLPAALSRHGPFIRNVRDIAGLG